MSVEDLIWETPCRLAARIGSFQKGNLRTQSQGLHYRTRLPTAASLPTYTPRAPVT